MADAAAIGRGVSGERAHHQWAAPYSLHCTKKLLDRIKPSIAKSLLPATTTLGNGYAKVLLWKPQLALLVNERTLLPVLMPLAPASTLAARFPDALVAVLGHLGTGWHNSKCNPARGPA